MLDRSIYVGVFFIALSALLLELSLIRALEVVWFTNIAYMIITIAIFSFGLSGVIVSIIPFLRRENNRTTLIVLAILTALSQIIIIAIFKYKQTDYDMFADDGVFDVKNFKFISSFLLFYLVITLPFFFSGLFLIIAFSRWTPNIAKLYFADLVGAAIGSVLIIMLISRYGAAGLIILASAFSLLAAANLFNHKILRYGVYAIAVLFVAVPPLKTHLYGGYIEFEPQLNKRSIIFATKEGRKDQTKWDPVSKIDIFNYGLYKWIAYDGGTQTSYFYSFDGDYNQVRKDVETTDARRHFWSRFVVASHYLKRDTDAEVLVIGSAGGQEIKAALTYGASDVDGVELVGAVVDFGKGDYAEYIGDVMNDPRVHVQQGEGRTFIRSTDRQYDIIQMMSNHTSSTMGSGNGALATTYLQTVEAYEEYFSHLKEDGILHINHHIYPRMITTAAKAWENLGRTDFRKHVMVVEISNALDTLPTFLVKMQAWTQPEVDAIRKLLPGTMVIDPIYPENNFLDDRFFNNELTDSDYDNIPFYVRASTDDRPYFNFLRKYNKIVPEDGANFLDVSTAKILNRRMQSGIPMDTFHLYLTSGAALFFAVIFLLLPLLFSPSGRTRWPQRKYMLGYFACLGAGFILFELTFIQVFMKFIGYPVYTYSLVVFTFLLGAGLGSFFSERIGNQLIKQVAFGGIVLYSAAFLVFHQSLFYAFLDQATFVRLLISIAMIMPLAFFLGMPFPCGLLNLSDAPKGSVPWAWAFNGLFTVIGSIASVLISIFLGFKIAIVLATIIYIFAALFYGRFADNDINPANPVAI